jgi:hypothetical protein
MADKWTYRCEYVKCGKPTCKRCPHGPYWYGYQHTKGGMKKTYFGKRDPRKADKPKAGSIAHKYDAIFNRQTASLKLAWEIMGCLLELPGKDEALRQFRKLVMEAHPDRGGSEQEMRWLNSAWSYIRAAKRW